MPYTLKELGMWLDLGCSSTSEFKRKLPFNLANFPLGV
jgi:hypothetical protein